MLPLLLESDYTNFLILNANLQSILSKSIFSIFIDLLVTEIDYLIFALEISLDFVNADVFANVKHNELVRNNAEFLQRDSLKTSAGEALNDPAGLRLLFFHLL